MQRISDKRLKEVIKLHQKWLLGEKDGVQADLSNTNLSDKTLSEVNLSKALLKGADLSNSFLVGANFTGANLNGATFVHSDLRYAHFDCAELQDTDFSDSRAYNASYNGAILSRTNFTRTKLFDADFRNAYCVRANFTEANLTNIVYYGAEFTDITTTDAVGIPHLVCPEVGSFTAYKKVLIAPDGNGYYGIRIIAELRVPKDALRSSATTRKCRCSKAKVVRFLNFNGEELDIKFAYSIFDKNFIYRRGETVKCNGDFDLNRWKACTTGIHFFMSFEEAVKL